MSFRPFGLELRPSAPRLRLEEVERLARNRNIDLYFFQMLDKQFDVLSSSLPKGQHGETIMIIYREYTHADKQRISEMMYALNTEDSQEMPLQEKKISLLFAFAPEKQWVTIFVAEKDEEVIGYAVFVKAFSVEFGGLYAEVDELYIKPERRAKGIGSAFLHWLELHAKDQGCCAMYLVATAQNTAAQRLYKRLGYNYLPRKSFVKLFS